MKEFNIEVISARPQKIDGLLSCWGRIIIGDFSEQFLMSLGSWNMEEYKQQWREGIERIKTYPISCLITSVTKLTTNPRMNFWSLYKVDDFFASVEEIVE